MTKLFAWLSNIADHRSVLNIADGRSVLNIADHRSVLNIADGRSVLLVGLALAVSGIFKLASFAREVLVASRFGISSTTDVYFGLQQLPLTLAAFMFGAFSLAFAPAYAESRDRSGRVDWMASLLVYGTLTAVLLTVITVAFSTPLLRLFPHASRDDAFWTLSILSSCYLPIVFIGIWSSTCIARGRNVRALIVTGTPYLLMTFALYAMCLSPGFGSLGLPISMALGFLITGTTSVVGLFRHENISFDSNTVLRPWRLPGFGGLTSRLAASCAENAGYTVNALLMLYFLARCGTGAISNNNCAMRIGMLGFSLLVQPLTQVMQGRLCTTAQQDRAGTFRKYFTWICISTSAIAVFLIVLRYPVTQLIYMHGKFSAAALEDVASTLPPWLFYFVIISLNAVTARLMYTSSKGTLYMRNMLFGYALANFLRLATAGSMQPTWIIWCSVIGEGGALLVNLSSCKGENRTRTRIRIAKEAEA